MKETDRVKYSEEFESLISSPPNWFLRSGLGSFLFVLLIFMVGGWFIKFPDTIDGEVKIVSTNHRKKIITKTQGRISFFKEENSFLKKNDIIGIIESPTSYTDVNSLKKKVDLIREKENLLFIDSLSFQNNLNLGELEVYYLDFLKKQNSFSTFTNLAILERQKLNLSGKLNHRKQLKINKASQNNIFSDKIELEKRKFERSKTLFDKGIISKADFEKAEADFLEIKRSFEIEKGKLKELEVINYEISGKISEIELEIIKDSILVKNELLNSFYQLFNKIEEWDHKFILRSPEEGILVYNSFWSNGQFVNINDEIGSVIPSDENIFGIAIIPTLQSGKVEEGQKCFIYLDNYPFDENGVIEANVKDVSPIPQDNTYRVKLSMNDGLTTTNDTKIHFTPELQGRVEIITKDVNVLQRIFYRIKSKVNGQ